MTKTLLTLLCALSLAACATTSTSTTPTTSPTARRSVRGEEFRVLASTTSGAGDAYDASMLFDRASQSLRAQRCDEAIALYERLIREFPDNARIPTAQFNRGQCLQRLERLPEAADAMRAAARAPRDPELTRDAWFRVAVLGDRTQQHQWTLDATDALLARTDLSLADRTEALARRAAAELSLRRFDDAERTAQQAITLAPTPESVAALGDDTYAAQARVVLADVFRGRASEVVYRIEDPTAEEAIARRVQLVTHAHVLFNEAIRAGNPQWAAAAGFHIGEMYSDLYHSIVDAPTPVDWDPPAREIYRRRTGERLRPLLQGALHSWEATLSMARRNGIADNEWVRRAGEALESLRALITGEERTPSRSQGAPTSPGAPAAVTVRPSA